MLGEAREGKREGGRRKERARSLGGREREGEEQTEGASEGRGHKR